jgi:hypothetical protein
MTDKHPWVALLGWFPLIYPFGVIRNWDKQWCIADGGFVPISTNIPVFWWPTRLYKHKQYEKQRYSR